MSAAEIRTLVQALTAPPVVVLTPSRSGLGTNGVLLAPPSAMRLRFGEPSFDGHVVAARALRLDVRIVRLPGLGLDVDAPEDLSMLLAEGAATESGRLLTSWRITRAPGRRRRGRPALTMPPRYEVIGIEGIGEVRPGDDVARLVVEAAARQRTPLAAADVLVLSQKIVSKSEGRLLQPERDHALADGRRRSPPSWDAIPRLIEVILRESRRIVRMDRGVLVTETRHGWVCANAGVDQSNVDADMVALLPEDSDRSARGFRDDPAHAGRRRRLRDHRRHVRPAVARGAGQHRHRRGRLRPAARAIWATATPPGARCRPPSWPSPTSWPAPPSR